MKKIIMLLCFATLLMAQNIEAQTKKKPTGKKTTTSKSKSSSAKAKEKESKDISTSDDNSTKEFFTEKMMYGSFVNYPYLRQGLFNMALSPMIGYKINNNIAAGLLTKVNYTWLRSGIATQPPLQILDLGVGVFARVKVLERFMVHAEYESTKYTTAIDVNLKPIKIRETSANAGIGYLSGWGKWKSEFGIYYDLLYNQKVTKASSGLGNTPAKGNAFDIRIGITYNF